MFKQICKIVIFVGLCASASAQQFLPSYSSDSTNRSSLDVNTYGIIGSTAIQNKMAQFFITGGLISDDLISDQLSNHKTVNRIGLNLSAEITYRNPYFLNKRYNNLGWSVKGGQQLVVGANYGQDLFRLLFQGNKEENELNFDKTYFNAQYFSKLGFGVFSKKTNASIHLNLIAAHNYADMYTRNTSYSNNESNLLDFSLDGAVSISNTNNFINGWGLGIDASFYIPFGAERDIFSGVLSIKVNNLGAVLYNQTTNIQLDTTVNYNGFSFSEINSLSSFNQQKLEDTLGIVRDTTSVLKTLPTFIQIGKEIDLQDTRSLQSFFGVRLMPTLAFLPQVYGGMHWRINQQFNVGAQLLYGGFSKFKGGFYGSYTTAKICFSLGSEDVVGIFSKQGRGASAVIRAIWRF